MGRTRTYRPAGAVLIVMAGAFLACDSSTGPGEEMPDPGVETAFLVCSGNPAWVAVQDGDEDWTAAPGSQGRYTSRFASDRVGIAYGADFGDRRVVIVLYRHRDEIAVDGQAECPVDRQLRVTASGVGPTERVLASVGGTVLILEPGQADTLIPTLLPEAEYDIVASATDPAQPDVPRRLLLRRGISASTAQISLDFAGPDSFEPDEIRVTLQNLSPDASSVNLVGSYSTSQPGTAYFGQLGLSTAADHRFPVVPEAHREPGDLHGISAFESTSRDLGRGIQVYFHETTDQALTFGPTLGPVTATVIEQGGVRMPTVRYSRQPEYDRLWSVVFSAPAGAAGTPVSLSMSEAYAAGSEITIPTPDLSRVGGWDAGWGLPAGVPVRYGFAAFGWSSNGERTPSDGFRQLDATRSGFVP